MMTAWPDGYPEQLKRLSWRVETNTDEVICGPLPYYTRRLDYRLKGSSLFVKQVLLDWFYKNGCCFEVCNDICQYYCKCFTVVYSEDEAAFRISAKKDRETKKHIFDEAEWMKLGPWQDKSQGQKMLKLMSKELVRVYNGMVKI